MKTAEKLEGQVLCLASERGLSTQSWWATGIRLYCQHRLM